MFDNNRKIKKFATIIILSGILVAGISGLRIRSVGQYRQEQQQLAKEILVDEPSGTDASTESAPPTSLQSTSLPDSKEEKAKSGEEENDSKSTEISIEQENNSEGKKTSAGQEDNSGDTGKFSHQKDNFESSKTSSGNSKQFVTTGKTDGGKATKKPSVKTTKKPSVSRPAAGATPTPYQSDGSFVCSITIRCDSLLKHWDDLSDSVKNKVPDNGFILEKTEVKMTSSDTAFSILQKVCKAKNIALDAEHDNIFSTEYVRGIGHLYEKEAGDMSGWLYRVNDKLLSRGSSAYQLHAGDYIEWVYTCTGDLE